MKRSTVELEIPADIIEEAQSIAQRRNSSLESALQDGLLMVFGTSLGCEVSMESLHNFSDEQLWKLVHHEIPGARNMRHGLCSKWAAKAS
jgi:surfactin synthase thioesterase subunit